MDAGPVPLASPIHVGHDVGPEIGTVEIEIFIRFVAPPVSALTP
jgi:hypothetical protein